MFILVRLPMYAKKLFDEYNEPLSEKEICALEILERQSGDEYVKYHGCIKEVEDRVHE